MSKAFAGLPPDWDQILDDIQDRLAQTLRTVEADLEAAAATDDAGAERAQEWVAACERLDRMLARAGQVEGLVRQADLALEAAEVALQAHAAASDGVRRRLAAWAGGAIG